MNASPPLESLEKVLTLGLLAAATSLEAGTADGALPGAPVA